MDIKEVEKLLSTKRANIRFYEEKGLIKPLRKENNYRNYSEEDVAALKKILVLRKLGFSVQEIIDMQNMNLSLDEAIEKNVKRLKETIEDLKGSLEITQKLEKDNTDFESINTDLYWNIINCEEQRGKKFTDICKDYLSYELDAFDHMWKVVFFHDIKKSRIKHGPILACIFLLLLCVLRGLSRKFLWGGTFLQGFLYPFELFLISTVALLPFYILLKKAPKVASVVALIMLIAIILFLVLLFLFIVVLLLNSAFHFWF